MRGATLVNTVQQPRQPLAKHLANLVQIALLTPKPLLNSRRNWASAQRQQAIHVGPSHQAQQDLRTWGDETRADGLTRWQLGAPVPSPEQRATTAYWPLGQTVAPVVQAIA